ncbi:MAG: hypothetical protein L6R40_001792 [Gallowayella cf. fulva]|nr:MAG: hypothetical protein L6R40_001792 [Xanthomendoza cf. fulva]
MSSAGDSDDVSKARREDEDLKNAILASLESHSTGRQQNPDKWIPKTSSDWMTYRRQQRVVETATVVGQVYEKQIESRPAHPPGSPGRRIPHSESTWTSYHHPQELGAEAYPETFVKKEQASEETFNESTKTHRGPETGSLESLTEQERRESTTKPEEDRKSQSEKILQVQADMKALEFYRARGTAEGAQTQPPPTTGVSSAPTPPTRQTIDDRIKEMQWRCTAELPWTNDPNGDTYVFIDPPAQQPEQTQQLYVDYVSRYQRPLVIHSTSLLALRSPYFQRILNPTAQYRTIRRRGLVGRLPVQIKYVIDLTPPSEGEDTVWLMTELCCVEGVRNWHQAWARWDVSKTLVGGKDEFIKQAEDEAQELSQPELSPIRHRTSIERVLNAIRNTDPKLDSAVKVYTTFAVARFFDIVHSPLTDYIVRWLRAPPNSLFIEALPEIALKIGDGFQCHDLLRDSFAILVGEEALANLTGKSTESHTVNHRKKNDVPESYQTRIEYGSKSFMDRILRIFAGLVEPNMGWMEALPQFQKLSNNENESLALLVEETKAAFKAYVRGAIYSVLWSDFKHAPKFDLGWEKGDSLYPRISQTDFWNSLNMTGRIMTTTFWSALKHYCNCENFHNPTNLDSWPQQSGTWESRLDESRKEGLRQKHSVAEVRYAYLKNLTTRCRKSQPGRSTGLLKPLAHQSEVRMTADDQQRSQLPLPWSDRPRYSLADVDNDDEPGRTSNTIIGPDDGGSNMLLDRYGIAVDLEEFRREIEQHIVSLCNTMLDPPDASNRDEAMTQIMTPTLVCLDEAEWKYLPMYAGGLDDGSGGVFNDDVPLAETGFSTAGPGVHTGTGSSAASSDFEYVGSQDLESTHHTSTMTNGSFSDQLDHRMVYDDGDDLWSRIRNNKQFDGSTTASGVDMATMVAPSTVDAESEDGFVLPLRPADLAARVDGSAVEVSMTSTRREEEARPIQEDYSDIFMGSDDEDLEDSINDDGDDNDTATEKGDEDDDIGATDEPGHGDSEDDDMILV